MADQPVAGSPKSALDQPVADQPATGSPAAGRPESAGTVRFGCVRAFDEHRGLGTLVDDQGAAWPFHCTAIADGSRTIEVGASVMFRAVPGHLGRMEAADVQPLPVGS